MLRNATFPKTSLSVSNPKYLRRAALQRVQSTKMCLTVNKEWQASHRLTLSL